MKVCSACGNRSNRPEAKRCDQCGAELPAKPTPVSQQQPPAPITKKLQQPVDRTRKFRMPETLTKEQDLPNDLPATGRHLLIGGPGTGKTHLATALGIAGLSRHGKRVRFYSTVDLVNALEQEKSQRRDALP